MYGIWCTRSRASVLGAAESWVKQGGKRLEFEDKAEAEIVSQRYNGAILTQHVHYQVRPL